MQKLKQKFLAVLAVAFGAVALPVQAALPTEATAVFTSLTGTVSDVSAAVWPIIGAVMILFLTIKLVRRGANKI